VKKHNQAKYQNEVPKNKPKKAKAWIPAFAGMTREEAGMTGLNFKCKMKN